MAGRFVQLAAWRVVGDRNYETKKDEIIFAHSVLFVAVSNGRLRLLTSYVMRRFFNNNSEIVKTQS